MRTTYTLVGRFVRHIIRSIWPIPRSPVYGPEVDICSVRLVPEARFAEAIRRAIRETSSSDTGATSAYVEFGVFNGTSLAAAMAAAREEGESALRLIGFDSFEGLPATVVNDDGGVWRPGQFACSRADATRCLAVRGLSEESFTLVDGWYEDLDPARMREVLVGRRIRILMIDCDAYSSARRALTLSTPYLAKKAIIFFDDWKLNDVDLANGGEYRAFAEWQRQNPGFRIRNFKSYSRKSMAFIVTR